MINFLADAFAAIFSVLCVIALAGIALIALGALGAGHPFAAPWIILAGFIALVLFVGGMATIIDMRRCLRRLLEIEETTRYRPPQPERRPPQLGPISRSPEQDRD